MSITAYFEALYEIFLQFLLVGFSFFPPCTVPLRSFLPTGTLSLTHTHVRTHTLTFHLAAVFDASLVGLDWQLEQRLQVGHRGQVSALRATSGRVAGPKLGAGGPGREIRR